MDPIAHTLVGATLAQTVLRKLTPLATATLVLGANLPDIDGVMSFFGSDASLDHRRGMTHGVLAQAIFPFLLTAGIMAYDSLWRRRRDPAARPARPLQVLLLAFIGVVSHPFLDWLNTYGVRLLMPFSDRWFYGDTLFIVDAWMWLLMGAAAVFATSQTGLKQSLWALVGLSTSWLVTTADFVPLPARIIWWIGLALILVFRFRGVSRTANSHVALSCLIALMLYVGSLAISGRHVHDKVEDWLRINHNQDALDLMVGPLPANPFAREIIVVSPTHYHGLRVPVFGQAIEERYQPVPLPAPDPVVQRALKNSDIKGFVNWMRYPVYDVAKVEEGYRVTIRDLRYVKPDQAEGRGIGMVETLVTEAMLKEAGAE